MLTYIARRVLQAVAVLLVVLTLVFIVVNLLGDPAILMVPVDATPEQIALVREQLGLNDPLYVRYLRFMLGVAQGSFGNSLWMHEPALGLAWSTLWPTLYLGGTAMLFALVVGLPLGLVAATTRKGWIEQLVQIISFGAVSVVEFWVGLMLILFFAVELQLLPTSGFGSTSSVILPAIVISLRAIGRIAQFTAEGVRGELAKPYARAAIARGVPRWRVVTIHALKNMAVPLVTLYGNELIQATSSIAIVEVVFAWPGEGRMLLQSIYNRDLPLVQASVFLFTVLIVLVNLTVDLLYGILDRRARLVS